MNKIRIFGLIVCLAIGSLPAQETLTPELAIELALKNNFSILIARNEQLSVEAGTTRGNAGMLPRVDVNAGVGLQNTNINQRFSNGIVVETSGVNNQASNASMSLGWTLYDGGKMFAAWDRLKEQKALSQLQILQTYFSIIRLQQDVKARQFGLDISQEQLLISQKKLELGSASRQELLQVTVDRNIAKSSLMQQELLLMEEKIKLYKLMDISLESNYVFPDQILNDFTPQIDQIQKNASEINVNIALAKGNLAINQFRLREIKAERVPMLRLNTGYNYTQSSSTAGFALFNQSNGLNGGLIFSWNLFNGSSLQSRLKQTQLQLENDALFIRNEQSLLDVSIRIAIQQWKQANEMLKLEEENFAAASENLTLALERLRLGSAGILVVKEAQRSYEEAISRKLSSSATAKNAEINLLKLSGTLLKR
jgi:outer membrane protein TolC